MRQTERVPLDALAEIAEIKRELRDLKATTLRRIHDASITWTDWSPTPTDLTVGNGTEVARFTKANKLIVAHYSLTWGSTTSIDAGNPKISLPVNASAQYDFPHVEVGLTRFVDSGTGTFIGRCRLESASTFSFGASDATSTYLTTTSISATVPMTWTTGDRMNFMAIYEAAV